MTYIFNIKIAQIAHYYIARRKIGIKLYTKKICDNINNFTILCVYMSKKIELIYLILMVDNKKIFFKC